MFNLNVTPMKKKGEELKQRQTRPFKREVVAVGKWCLSGRILFAGWETRRRYGKELEDAPSHDPVQRIPG